MRAPLLSLNPRLVGRPPSATLAIGELCAAMRARGQEVYSLGLGQSPFPVLPAAVRALREHAGENDYLPVPGLPALREAIAVDEGREHGMSWRSDQVLVAPGSKELMFLLQLALRAELVLPAATWVSYAPQAWFQGNDVAFLPARAEEAWQISPELLDAHCRRAPDRPRLLALTSPNNPTGVSCSPARLEALAEVCRRHRVVVLSDEIYARTHYDDACPSIAPLYPEGTIVSTGLSKWCGAGGWRLGVFLFPPQLAALQAVVQAAASQAYTSVAAPIQHAAITAYQDTPERRRYLEDGRRVLRALVPRLAGILRGVGARIPEPDSAFYLFVDLSPVADGLQARGLHSSTALVHAILQDTGVALLPGSALARPAEEPTLRLACVDFDGTAALAQAAEVEGELDEATIRRVAPRTFEAVERLAEWVEQAGGEREKMLYVKS